MEACKEDAYNGSIVYTGSLAHSSHLHAGSPGGFKCFSDNKRGLGYRCLVFLSRIDPSTPVVHRSFFWSCICLSPSTTHASASIHIDRQRWDLSGLTDALFSIYCLIAVPVSRIIVYRLWLLLPVVDSSPSSIWLQARPRKMSEEWSGVRTRFIFNLH